MIESFEHGYFQQTSYYISSGVMEVESFSQEMYLSATMAIYQTLCLHAAAASSNVMVSGPAGCMELWACMWLY